MGFGPLSLVKPLWPLFLCFSFGVSSWTVPWLVYIPAFSRFQICSCSSECLISLPLRAFNMLQPLDWFVWICSIYHRLYFKEESTACTQGALCRSQASSPSTEYRAAGFGRTLDGCWGPPSQWDVGVLTTSWGGTAACCVSTRAGGLIKIPSGEELEARRWALCTWGHMWLQGIWSHWSDCGH